MKPPTDVTMVTSHVVDDRPSCRGGSSEAAADPLSHFLFHLQRSLAEIISG